MQRPPPGAAEVVFADLLLPVRLERRIRGAFRLSLEDGEQFMSGTAVVKRLDQWLQDCRGAIERTGVAPRLQCVSGRQMPIAEERRFVVILRQMDAVRDF